ncbi:dual specificity mitogen-activated protein kinase kinase 4 [Glossina fuscipes]|uniref:mitogen-activated protein kinase kinase n=3 Tax=Glossina TaxID=7393 RepID=A0A9C6DU05_9MUSC|nr:dual specificity mitogen-activated protein kinase kinase 4 [Glossina fuscipes]XP_037892026.1 dual specificity mitogen-activated protein kinase kinase 4 [Glossina fuscipes]XP_037892027.1 dual specificity mitogen-activated protein kinase kinase 4 [Glossina fuscipes]
MAERPKNLFAGGSCRPRMPPNELNFSTFSMRHPPSSLSSTSSGSASSTSSILVGALPIMPTDRTRERIKQQACGKLQLGSSPQDVYQFTSDDLEDLGEIGRGAFGAVNKMIFKKIDKVMAVKRIRATVDEKEQKQLLMDLEVVMKSNDCNYIVQFYGALFKEGDCWICMELMDTSLDKFYKYIFERKNQRVPESILAKITVATVHALNYLKEKLKIIHRDVKPSNILLHKRGDIKLCDFGISGQLVDSIAKTKDAGCRPYMAPERIDPERAKGYDVRSDVWSLGITLMEVATGNFPYRKWDSVFEQLCQVVQGDPPRLQQGQEFSTEFVEFVNTCLIKNESERPKYDRLLEMPFILRGERSHTDVAAYVTDILEAMENDGITQFTTNQPAES